MGSLVVGGCSATLIRTLRNLISNRNRDTQSAHHRHVKAFDKHARMFHTTAGTPHVPRLTSKTPIARPLFHPPFGKLATSKKQQQSNTQKTKPNKMKKHIYIYGCSRHACASAARLSLSSQGAPWSQICTQFLRLPRWRHVHQCFGHPHTASTPRRLQTDNSQLTNLLVAQG